MRIAGIGFRAEAASSALSEALDHACGGALPDALATLDHKADAPQMRALSKATGLPVLPVTEQAVEGIETPTQSPRILARFGTGSLAEAVALVAAGPGARLVTARVLSQCGGVTVAIAEGDAP